MALTKEQLEKVVALEQSPKLTQWEREFLASGRKYGSMTVKMSAVLDRIYEEKILTKQRDRDMNQIIKSDRVMICKSSGGWQLYVDMKALGYAMTRPDAE